MLIELRIATCAAMLVAAAIIDVRKREIPDKIWVGFGGFGALLAAIDFTGLAGNNPDGSSNQTALFGYLLGIGLITPIGYAIYKTGLFGGADSKALIAIAVILPPLSGIIPFQIHGFTALTVLTNALIISMSQLVVNAGRNLVALAKGMPIFEGIEEGTARKALAFAMGQRVCLSLRGSKRVLQERPLHLRWDTNQTVPKDTFSRWKALMNLANAGLLSIHPIMMSSSKKMKTVKVLRKITGCGLRKLCPLSYTSP
jgi:Flp pilus assembly protein protease CpaA